MPVPGKKVWSAYCSFLLSGVKTVIFFLCKVEHYSIIKPVFLISLKAIIRKSAKYVATNKVKLININILAPVQSKNKRGEKYNL